MLVIQIGSSHRHTWHQPPSSRISINMFNYSRCQVEWDVHMTSMRVYIYIEREIWCHRVHFCQLRFIVIFCLSLHLSLIKSCAESGSRNNNYIHIREDAHTPTHSQLAWQVHFVIQTTQTHLCTHLSAHPPIRVCGNSENTCSRHVFVKAVTWFIFHCSACDGESGNECVLAWATASFWKDEWVQYIL